MSWWLAVVWVGLGSAECVYVFVMSTHRSAQYMWVPAWVGESGTVYAVAGLCQAGWVLLAVPVLVAGCIRLWRQRRSGVAGVAWFGAWVVGLVLIGLCIHWQANPPGIMRSCGQGCSVLVGFRLTPASWAELPVGAGFLALGVLMTRILARRGLPQD